MSTMISIALVRASDGSVDQDATLASCEAAITQYVAEKETEDSTISAAVHSLFDEHKGARLNMPYVQNEALRRLNVQPASFKYLSERVAQFVRDHSQGAKLEDGTWECPDGEFNIGRGKGGGVCRVCDIPEPTTTK